ncbi:UNVERIFIED_CONTAM: hypothetical protein Cloal_1981 [Acetivibrio alkalicellulosi]
MHIILHICYMHPFFKFDCSECYDMLEYFMGNRIRYVIKITDVNMEERLDE